MDVLAIVGSTRFACLTGQEITRRIITLEVDARRPDEIVSGGADGVDTIGEMVAHAQDVPFRGLPPARHRWAGPGGFKERNQHIADTCTRLLRIVCAESETFGSGWTANVARKQGKPVRQVVIAADGSVTDTGWPA